MTGGRGGREVRGVNTFYCHWERHRNVIGKVSIILAILFI